MKSKVRVAIVDDHGLLRQGIQSLLQNVDDIEIVATAASGEEAVTILSTHTPDVYLMDIVMRGINGIEAARWIKEQSPQTKIILISGEVSKELIGAGIKAGVNGYLPKDSGREMLIDAVHTVVGGNSFFSPEVAEIILQNFHLKEKGSTAPPEKKTAELTKREEEVLTLVASGKSMREIADELYISLKTVETHKQHIQDKLGLKNTAQLVRYAIDNKLI